jgi:hypothetical protein
MTRRFAPVWFHLPVFLLSAAQFSVPGPHQTNLLGQPRFSSRPMDKTVSHNRIPRTRAHLHAAHPPCEPSCPPACQTSSLLIPINLARVTLVSHLSASRYPPRVPAERPPSPRPPPVPLLLARVRR